jgi:hypothetical protein
MIEPQLKYDLVLIKRYVRRRLWGCGRYLYRQRLSPPIQERRGLMDNESILLGIQPDFRNVDQGSISSYIFLSDNARPCIHTPYAFCYRPRPSCDFFSCALHRISAVYIRSWGTFIRTPNYSLPRLHRTFPDH